MTKTPQEMLSINSKCAELLGLYFRAFDNELYADKKKAPDWDDRDYAFNIFYQYADLMAVAEKLDLTIQRRLAKVLDDYACHRGGECLKSSKSMREAILECVIAVMEGL